MRALLADLVVAQHPPIERASETLSWLILKVAPQSCRPVDWKLDPRIVTCAGREVSFRLMARRRREVKRGADAFGGLKWDDRCWLSLLVGEVDH